MVIKTLVATTVATDDPNKEADCMSLPPRSCHYRTVSQCIIKVNIFTTCWRDFKAFVWS